MKRRFLLIFISFLIYLPGFAASKEGFMLSEIKFEGLINGKVSDLLNLLPIRTNEMLVDAKLNRAVKRLYGLDMFDNVKLYLDQKGERVIARFVVKENPLIRKIEYKGNKSVSKSTLEEDGLALSEGSYFTKAKSVKMVAQLTKVYEDQGFIKSDISYKLKPVDENQNSYDLIFNVKEGKKIVVEKIEITGNKNVKTSDIKGIMKTKESIFIIQPGILKEDDFASDARTIQQFYQQKGYLDVRLKRFDWKVEQFGKDKQKHPGIAVYLDIDEGVQYKTGEISISNNVIFTTQDLMKIIPLKKGDLYDRIKMEYARYQIYNKYSDNGHLYANVSMVLNKRTNANNENIVDTHFVIFEGARAHIENITVSGNTKTLDKVITRELLFNEGELYVQRKVKQSKDRLMQLQYFKDVQFRPVPGSSEGLVNMNIQVEENRTGLITFGAGYGTESGINGTGQITEKNLFGTGRSVAFKGEYGQRRQSLELSFTEPWLFDTPTYAGISFSIANNIYAVPTDNDNDGVIDGTNINYITDPTNQLTDFTSKQQYNQFNISLGVNLNRRFAVFWNISGSYAFSTYKKFSDSVINPLAFTTAASGYSEWQTDTNLQAVLAKDWTLKNVLNLGLGYNSTDNPLNQTRGQKFNINVAYTGGVFGGNIDFIHPKVSFNTYWNPWWKLVFALHVTSEALLPQFDGSLVPDDTDLLWFDGTYQMRGFQGTSYVKGQAKNFASLELRHEIYTDQLWGAFFFDYGKIFTEYKDWTLNPNNYLFSFGYGVKVNIPMIPLRFWFARIGSVNNGKMILDHDQNIFNFNDTYNEWKFVLAIQGLF